MIVGLGVDLFETGRLAAELGREGPAFAACLFTPAEIADCETHRSPARRYAALFAAKEAVIKALGLDERAAPPWRDVGVEVRHAGVRITLRGAAAAAARRRGATRILASLSQTRTHVAATALLES